MLQLATALHFDKRDRVHLYRVALYCTLLELAGNVLHLVEHKRRTGVPSLFRDCLEAAIELKNIMKDVGYSDHITASHCYEWLRLLKEAKKGTNRYLTSIAASQNLNEEIANYEKQLQELKARGKRPLTNLRFERAEWSPSTDRCTTSLAAPRTAISEH